MELDKQIYGTQEVAEILGVSRFAVWLWCKTGKIKAGKTPGGHYRIPREEVLRLLKELRGEGNGGDVERSDSEMV